uniref:Endoplasmic reticulum vesicle transporter C-terminal domain-containing protein n=1 Tax=Arcella intermedia TaxID=1963864 RepID=A0A6B2L6T7_9EUKA
MVLLFFNETSRFVLSDVHPSLFVDDSADPLQVNLDIDFLALPCAFISVNAMDKTGGHQLNIHHNVYTTRIDKTGNPLNPQEKEEIGEDKYSQDIYLGDSATDIKCGSCYGAETEQVPCCNSCDEIQEAYRKKGWAFVNLNNYEQCVKEDYMGKLLAQRDEGCRVHGMLQVQRVGGHVNIVPGKFILQNSRFVVDSNLYQFDGDFNLTHRINHFSFGIEYPGRKNPLDGMKKIWVDEDGSPMYEYYTQVVSTIYEDKTGIINTNQYSVTEYMEVLRRDNFGGFVGRGVPGLFFMYELSPISIDYVFHQKSFLHFLTNLCAIIGGVFTVATLIDTFIFKGLNTLQKKIELGKQG